MATLQSPYGQWRGRQGLPGGRFGTTGGTTADYGDWAETQGRGVEERGARAESELDFQRELDKLNAAAAERLTGLYSRTGGGPGGNVPNVPRVPIEGYSGPGYEAASSAAFARAKDRIGGATGGALRSLQSIMAQRGITGSGIEAAETGRVIGAGVGAMGEAGRDIAMQQERRAAEVSDRNLAAGLTQRGQDIDVQRALIDAETQRRMQILQLIRAQQERKYLF